MSKHTLKSRGYLSIREFTSLCGIPKHRSYSVYKALCEMGYIQKSGRVAPQYYPIIKTYLPRKPSKRGTPWTPLISPEGAKSLARSISKKFSG